jgi:transcriptional regulator with XRE-family HTH domain
MVKQTMITMKQPELGQKILELRKAKGLTQENLVELCSINVRTIQRIEAGEVTPRSYTIKAILEALGYDFTNLQMESEEKSVPSTGEKSKASKFLIKAFFIGIVYFLLAYVELAFDFMLLESGELAVSNGWYFAVKIAIILTFSFFIMGYYKLSFLIPNNLIKGASIFLIVGIVVSNSFDMFAVLHPVISIEIFQIAKSIVFGALYLVFGIGLIGYQKQFGSLAFVGGCLGILSGIMFISVILVLPGLVVFTIFEILQLILLFKAAEHLENPKSQTPSNAVQWTN